MILVDTCETINESMIQLIFQTVFILTSKHNEPITTTQYLVLATSLVMASKGPAEAFLAAKLKRLSGDGSIARQEEQMDKIKTSNEPVAYTDEDDNKEGQKILLEQATKEVDDKEASISCFEIKPNGQGYHELEFFKQKLPLIGQSNNNITLHSSSKSKIFKIRRYLKTTTTKNFYILFQLGRSSSTSA